MTEKTTYRELTCADLHPNALDHFNRFQETTKTWVEHQGQLVLEDTHFIDDWDAEKKGQVIDALRHCLSTGGVVVGAYRGENLIGFANIEGKLFGSQNQYLELAYIHVSNGIRKAGIGRSLFDLICEKAKKKAAKKLYIGAHSSQESQAFYRSLGCVLAVEINQEIFRREPLDIQLEYSLESNPEP